MATLDAIPLNPVTIGPVMTGRARAFRGDEPSAIAKTPAEGPVRIGPLGLEGDEQADRINHGGPDKAIHHYALDHYSSWQEEIGPHPLLGSPGGFGENISTTGLTESDLWIGDRLRLGTALVEVSHGRQPCWKIDHRFQRKDVTARIIQTARSGWYYRVIEPGSVQAGDTLELVERGHEGWSVERVFRLLLPGKPARDGNEIRELAGLSALADVWKARARKLLGE
ncbi:molybdenum cofactor biosysynthesis protein [Croceicoccus estronivorus]|uniref:MOSC domain-containing protein n=1 Tax=Croceicoccus estronivorus TaxID=1172626 RepID=UPI00082DCCFB|nr:MOSC domain-containing protein [Croceicoccus estronivorus]OCC23214.1 molybdenum cofactor biosysynthesis protein [Croceicoccus estronivorus]